MRTTIRGSCSYVVFLWGLLPLLANSLPNGFVKEFVANKSAVSGKWASNPRKNGKPMLLLASDSGTVRVLENPDESDETITILDLRFENKELCTNGERGLQSVEIHPNFHKNFFVYTFYTSYVEGCLQGSELSPFNVVARYRMDPNTLQLVKNSKKEIWRGAPTKKQNHNGGALAFGNDGKLYITTGDGGDQDSVQPLSNSHGSIIRLNDDGSVPSDNPFANQKKYNSYRCADSGGVVPADAPDDAVCSEVFANGLRNPFRIEMDPNEKEKVRFAISDVGGNIWEELNWAGTDFAGRNYGYPIQEGPCLHGKSNDCPLPDDRNILEPFHWYAHRKLREGGCVSGAVIAPDDLQWPKEYKFLFADFIFFEIYNLIEDPDAYCRACTPPLPGYRNETFYQISPVQPGGQRGSITDMFFGPYKDTQALYIVLRGGDEKVIRIRYTGDTENSPPVPVIRLKGEYKYEVGEVLEFDASESSDPDGDVLTFAWDFGDGTQSREREPTHSFQKTGKYQVELVVMDSSGISQRTSMAINIGNPPEVFIVSPAEGETFFVGQIFKLKGEAFNFKGERLSDSSLTWEVRKHHADHFHPFLDLTHGNDFDLFPAPEPEDFLAATNSYLEIILKATDENGLVTEVSRLIQPFKVNIDIESNLPGIEVSVDDHPMKTSEQIISWKKHKLKISANDQPPFVFRSWWDGDTKRERVITIEEDGQSALAIYCAITDASCSLDEECCSGSCEKMTCKSSSVHDLSHGEEGLSSSSSDRIPHSYHDKQGVEDEDDFDDKQPSRTGIMAWIYDDDSLLGISDAFLYTIVSAIGMLLLLSIGVCIIVKRKRKKVSNNKNDGDSSTDEEHSQDEEKGLCGIRSRKKSRRIPNSRKKKNKQEVFVSGGGTAPLEKTVEVTERKVVDKKGFDHHDIELVMSQAKCSRVKAITALMENDADLVDSILSAM